MQLALKCIVFSFTFYLKQTKCSKKSTLFFKHWNKISLAGHKKLLGGPKRLAGRILCGNDVNNDNVLFLWNPKATASASVLRDEVSLFENFGAANHSLRGSTHVQEEVRGDATVAWPRSSSAAGRRLRQPRFSELSNFRPHTRVPGRNSVLQSVPMILVKDLPNYVRHLSQLIINHCPSNITTFQMCNGSHSWFPCLFPGRFYTSVSNADIMWIALTISFLAGGQ
jgi:hypothetical protein